MIDKELEGTREELESIALGLGYAKAIKDLNRRPNAFKYEDKEDYRLVTELAKCNRKTLIQEVGTKLIRVYIKEDNSQTIQSFLNEREEIDNEKATDK